MRTLPPKTKMTQAEWDEYVKREWEFFRYKLKMPAEDIDITPEGEWVEIVPSQEEKEEFREDQNEIH